MGQSTRIDDQLYPDTHLGLDKRLGASIIDLIGRRTLYAVYLFGGTISALLSFMQINTSHSPIVHHIDFAAHASRVNHVHDHDHPPVGPFPISSPDKAESAPLFTVPDLSEVEPAPYSPDPLGKPTELTLIPPPDETSGLIQLNYSYVTNLGTLLDVLS